MGAETTRSLIETTGTILVAIIAAGGLGKLLSRVWSPKQLQIQATQGLLEQHRKDREEWAARDTEREDRHRKDRDEWATRLAAELLRAEQRRVSEKLEWDEEKKELELERVRAIERNAAIVEYVHKLRLYITEGHAPPPPPLPPGLLV